MKVSILIAVQMTGRWQSFSHLDGTASGHEKVFCNGPGWNYKEDRKVNTMNILLSTQEDAVKFVRTVSRYPFDVDLSEGGDTIDAKSILGVLSVAVGRMMQLKIHTEHPEELCSELQVYLA